MTATMFDFPALYQAYIACRRGKRASHNTQRYEVSLLDHLVSTSEALQSRRWSPARSVSFICTRPKAREIHAADFTDRVVHHLLVPKLEALYEPLFIHDSYSNRTGKGTHAATDRLQLFMRRVTCNGKRRAYFLQLDIRNFFNSIDRSILLSLLQSRLEKAQQQKIDACEYEALNWLCTVLLQNSPAEGAYRRGHPDTFAAVPAYKQLAHAPDGCGIAIGNLTSQFFANVYLNELDQFIKHDLKCACYLRYVDDFVLLHESADQLVEWRGRIEAFLAARLGLELKALNEPCPVSAGCDFLGYVSRPHYRLVRRRALHHCQERLREMEQQIVHAQGVGTGLMLKAEQRQQLQASLNSYFGHFIHADSHRLQQALFARFAWLRLLFLHQTEGPKRLLPLWQPVQVNSFRSQWMWFHQRFSGVIQLIQLGKMFACFAPGVERLPELVKSIMRPGKSLPGLDAMWSAPLASLKQVRSHLRACRMAHLFVAEEGHFRGGMKRRVLRLLWLPDAYTVSSNCTA